MHPIDLLYLMIALNLVGMVSAVANIGKPREPYTVGYAAAYVFAAIAFTGVYLWLIALYGGAGL